jgi:hypothetical protein
MNNIKIDMPGKGLHVEVPDGALVSFDAGLQVSAGLALLFQGGTQPYVKVNTEDLGSQNVDGNGNLLIAIHLNSAVIFDDEGEGDRTLSYLDERGLWGAAERVLLALSLKVEAKDLERDVKLKPLLSDALDVFDVAESVAATQLGEEG